MFMNMYGSIILQPSRLNVKHEDAYNSRKPFAILYQTFDYVSKRNIQEKGKSYFSTRAIHHFKLGCSHPCHKNVIKCELMLRHIHRRRVLYLGTRGTGSAVKTISLHEQNNFLCRFQNCECIQ